MKKTGQHFIVWLLVFWGIVIGIENINAASNLLESNYPITRQIQYSFTLQNKTNHLIKKAEFWAYAPVKQTSTQLCTSLEISHPYQLIIDDLNNQILHFTFTNLAPYTTKIIVVKARLRFSDKPISIPVQNIKPYLQPEKYVESDTPEISRIAKKFKNKKTIKTTKSIFKWVAKSIKYIGYLKNDRGALYALKEKHGDCTEFMYLFTALCRANNIPARGVGGYVYNEKILNPNDYHNWAEFYDGDTWKIADSQKKVFVQNQSNYVAMRIIGKSLKNPMGNSHRFRIKGDDLKVKINKLYLN